jgi:hypothetical protein
MAMMTDSELKSVLSAEIADSLAHLGGELSEQRRKALRYYLAEPFGNEQEGRSKVMSTDVADVIEWYNDSQWVVYGDGDGAFAVAYVSPTSFSVNGVNATAIYHVGRRVKASGTLTGTIHGTITGTSFATNTTVTVAWDSGALQNEALLVAIGILSATSSAMPPASATAAGAVQLASAAETGEGSSAAKAVTPAALTAAEMIWGSPHIFRSADSAAGEAVAIDLDRASATPAANDLLMALRWKMRDTGGGTDVAAKLVAKLLDPTAGNEDAELGFYSIVGGAIGERMTLGQGLKVGAPAGGDPGAGSINAIDYYRNGVRVPASDVDLVTGTTHAPIAADHGKTFVYTHASGCVVTLPGIADVFAGYRIALVNESGAAITANRSGTDTIEPSATTFQIPNVDGCRGVRLQVANSKWLTSTRRFRSSAQTPAANTDYVIPHNLGATPNDGWVTLHCKTSELGYVVGQQIQLNVSDPIGDGANGAKGMTLAWDGTNVEGHSASNAQPFSVVTDQATNAQDAITNANWDLYLWAQTNGSIG